MKRVTTASVLVACALMTVWGAVFSAAWGATAPATAPMASPLLQKLEASGTPTIHSINSTTGRLRFLAGENRAVLQKGSPTLGSEGAARAFLDSYGPMFGIAREAEELVVKRITTPDQSRSFVRFQQLCKALPVYGGELVVQLGAGSDILSVNGSVAPDCSIDTTPAVAAVDAKQVAISLVAAARKVAAFKLTASEPELYVYNPALLGVGKNSNVLVWRMDVRASDLTPVRELVLVDARSGAVPLHFNQICTALQRSVYDKNNDPWSETFPGLPEELARTEGGAATGIEDVDNAYDFAGDTYNFYKVNHARESIDGHGMPLISTVRYCPPDDICPYPNAFWSGEIAQMVYGDGFASGDDVVGHELTHGVTEHESNLIYFAQSGAINESLSDLWGEFVDLANGKGNDEAAVRWLMGEDLSIGAIRNMQDPTDPSMDPPQPDKMSSEYYFCNSDIDNGGVHYNSGINNKAIFLMTDGGTFNGKTVTGLGITKVAKIYYEAQTNILTSGTQYPDLYDALQLACTNLNSSQVTTVADCVQVKNALDAVEMSQTPPNCVPQASDLAPYQPEGWSAEVVVSKSTGTNTDGSNFSTTDDLFVDWAVGNYGEGATEDYFDVTLYVDGVARETWTDFLPSYYYDYVLDYGLGKLSAGTHTIKVTADSSNKLAESDETNNSFTKTITISGGGGYNISGTVRSGSLAGPALAGATVSVAGQTTTTGVSGTFSFTGIAAGTYTLTISKSGYQSYSNEAWSVNASQAGLNFYLVPLYTVNGTVRSGSATGPLLAGALVKLAGKSATTSVSGTFSIASVPAGTYTLSITKSGFVTYVASYAVNANKNDVFVLKPLYSLSGTVRSTSGAVVAGAVVKIGTKTATTSYTGTFSITDIPAGTYTLTITKAGFETYSASCAVTGTKTGLTYYLKPLYNLSGTVRSTTGAVVAGAVVKIGAKTAITTSTGTFSIIGVTAGTYTLTITKSGYQTYTASYAVTGTKTGAVFYLKPLYSISGTVRAGSATGPVLAGAKVSIAGKTALTGSTGTFSITAIPAGTYTITISRTGYRTYTGSLAVTTNKAGLIYYLLRL